jgi:DNA-binding MarR family transcriptional regulator
MDIEAAETIAHVRRFGRTVAQRVGALNDHFLARDRPLGPSRVLWEIGREGCDVRTLRARLDLDSGYLSRILRGLEADGLVTVEASERDGRVRTARLTPAGETERVVLDERSDELAASILEPLSADQRQRLVAAMAEVERLLAAALVGIEVIDPAHTDARRCLAEYYAELDRRFAAGYDPGKALPADTWQMTPPHGAFLVARLRGEPVGCGGLKLHGDEPAEVKRMWVDRTARGLGVGRRLLGALEERARDAGAPAVRLETNRALTEAIALYRSTGYREVAPFNDEPYGDHWFEKALPPPPS